MKAIINGMTIEGTPQEIAEYQRLTEAKAQEKPVIDWPKLGCGGTISKCPNEGNACFCTGACIGKDKTGFYYGSIL